MIVRNMIKCKKCGDVIESKSVHDFQTCSCGACSVDGGHAYLRRCGKSLDDFIDMSEIVPDKEEKSMKFRRLVRCTKTSRTSCP